MGRKIWNVSKIDKAYASEISQNLDIDPFAALLLASRGICEYDEIEEFFSDEAEFCDPYELRDMDKAVERIERALENGEKIAVYGDYDADGVTSTAVMYLFFEKMGADITYYIPDRNTEGYGLNKEAIKELSEKGVNLIVTVDNGISAIEEAEYIYELGMELVVTDHHKVGRTLPRAEAVVDAHRPDCESTYKHWSGVGIAFKLLCALTDGDYEYVLKTYADIITLGTIGDVVSLTGENRAIVKYGLSKINNFSSPAVEALKKISGTADKKLNATSVAFTLVPRINAIGRVERAEDAFRLLISDSLENAEYLAEKIDKANAERQRLEHIIMEEAEKQLSENPLMEFDRVLVFDGLDWHGGVIGIVAARLVERFGKPVIVITSDGIEAKGSGRSIEGFSLYDCIESASYMLSHFGGHTLAAGFGLKSEDIERFRKAVNDYAKTVEMPFAALNIDCKLRPQYISADLIPVIEELEPFGAGNPQPLFGLYGMTLSGISPIGGGKHLRLTFTKEGATITALKFGMTQSELPYRVGDILDLAVRLEKNEYMGQVRVSVYIKEMRMSGTDDEVYLKSVRLYEKIRRKEKASPERAKAVLPDRAFVGEVYKYIKKSPLRKEFTDVLCYRLSDDGSAAARVLMSIDILKELSLLEENEGEIKVSPVEARVNLESSELMMYLKNLCQQ